MRSGSADAFGLAFVVSSGPSERFLPISWNFREIGGDGVEPTIETGKPRPRTPWYVIEQGSSIDDWKCCFDDDLASLDSVMLIIFTIWADNCQLAISIEECR